MNLRGTLLITSLALPVILALSACSNSENPATNTNSAADVNTGLASTETQVAPQAPAQLSIGQQLYISAERLRVRSTAEIADKNTAGVLEANDKVEIQDPTEIGDQKFVAIKVIDSKSKTPKDVVVYAPRKYLNPQPVILMTQDGQGTKITVITNLATQKMRIYRQCEVSENCKNRMIFETDVVTGEDEEEKRTNVGSYRVESWLKFYETPGVYPAWYKAGYPPVPKPGGGPSDWVSSKYMPGGKGDMRGAFGWYTAFVNPNNHGQWMHGTAGWGADKKEFTMFRYTVWARILDIFTSVDSHGCTRTDNESIAFARSNVPVGARYIKVYAKEALRDPTRAAYSPTPGRFDYILTKVGAQHWTHEPADRATVLADNTPASEYLEQGTLAVDAYPTPIAYKGDGARSGDNYDLGKDAFTGVFLVDEGTFVGYKHPVHKKIKFGGFMENGEPAEFPSANISADTNYTMPAGGK